MARRITKEQFLDLAKEVLENLNIIEIKDYKRYNESCIFRDHIGEFSTSPSNLMRKSGKSFHMYFNKLDQKKYELLKVNDQLKSGEIKIINAEDLKSAYDTIYIQDKYGICASNYMSLKSNMRVTIQSAINRVEYFKNIVYEKNKFYRDGCFEILEYVGKGFYIVKNKYGKLKVNHHSLSKDFNPKIRLAINKTDYTINRLKEIHGDKYDYSKVKYPEERKGKIELICKKHGSFTQHLFSSLEGKGCDKCREEKVGWSKSVVKKQVEKSGYGILYMINIFNDKESFLKIGYTTIDVKTRFKRLLKDKGYNYKIINTYKTSDGEKLFNTEVSLKQKYKKYRYTPQNSFDGSKTEVFEMSQYENILKEFNELPQ